jgi:hypothetical protein
MAAIGHTTWVIPGGRIPVRSTGREPDFTSRDELCALNTGPSTARLKLHIYYSTRDPVGPYEISVSSKRVVSVRFNDLIDPEAIPLDEPFACVIESDVPIVVQFTRQDTSQPENAISTTVAFPWS